jgi:aminoglycoside phosphotransferase (APT) family kinase protein
MHAGQHDVDAATVRRLVASQFPQWRHLAVTPVPSPGTVNAIFRVGDGLAARLPLQGDDPEAVRACLAAEAEAAAELHGSTRVPTPEPVALGEPGAGYPLPWSVQTWLPGSTAFDLDPAASSAFAADLAAFVADVRALDTRGRPFRGTGRGGDLRDQDAWVEECLDRSSGVLDVPPLRALWAELRPLPRADPDLMTHGDLVPGNVLVTRRDGHLRLGGVLDVGGLGPADPALDLVGAWHLLDPGPRRVLRDELATDELQWERGRAWAFAQAIGLVWYYATTNPVMSALGRRTLGRLLDDPGPPPGRRSW